MTFKKQKYPKWFSYEYELDRIIQEEKRVINIIEKCSDPAVIGKLSGLLNKLTYHKYWLEQIDRDYTR